MTQIITVILHEGGTPWPLIYTVEADPADEASVFAAAVEARLNDMTTALDDDDRRETREAIESNLEIYFAFAGDLRTVADWRE